MGEAEVTINYESIEISSRNFQESPVSKLEICKYGFDVKRMQFEEKYYFSMFPGSVSFKEDKSAGADEVKDKVFNMEPEGKDKLKVRAISLVERMNRRANVEHNKGVRNVCYLIVSHGAYVDELKNILTVVAAGNEEEAKEEPVDFLNMTDIRREKLLTSIQAIKKYSAPSFCSMTAFKILDGGAIENLLKCHQAHIEQLLGYFRADDK